MQRVEDKHSRTLVKAVGRFYSITTDSREKSGMPSDLTGHLGKGG